MTVDGYCARMYAVKWHANLWRIYGTPIERCEAMALHCAICVDNDFYGKPRPITDDPEIERMQRYLDHLFAQDYDLVSYA